ncbi:MAG: alpha/beta hydrolase family protein [Flavobacteriales bacterium]
MSEEKNIRKEPFFTQCADGVTLKGLLLIPENPRAVIQFNGGTAAKKEFYLAFLQYLAENGYACCLWDYRGSGESAPADMKHCEYRFRDYGLLDMPAIRDFLRQRFPELPMLLVTHSAGGQQVGFMDDLRMYKGMLGFGVSTGYLKHMPAGYRLKSTYFFYGITPLSILFSGYLQAKRLGLMEDLPRNVVREWRNWCEKKDYFFDPAYMHKTVPPGSFSNLGFPVHIYWTPDDPIANERSVPTFWSHVHSDKGITFTKLSPAEMQQKTIGHFGFFRKNMRETLWRECVQKLDSFTAHSC